MAIHKCDACLVTCIDFRFQQFIDDWIKKNLPEKSFDRVAFAGGVKNIDTILDQINTSQNLHSIQRVVLINHEDCGAYGEAGTPEKHAEDLKNAAVKIKNLYPDLTVDTYYLHLDGTFEQV